MPEPTAQDNRALLRRTLVAAGAMVGACAVIVGSLTLVASAVVGHAVSPRNDFDLDGGGSPPSAPTVHTLPVLRPPLGIGLTPNPTPR